MIIAEGQHLVLPAKMNCIPDREVSSAVSVSGTFSCWCSVGWDCWWVEKLWCNWFTVSDNLKAPFWYKTSFWYLISSSRADLWYMKFLFTVHLLNQSYDTCCVLIRPTICCRFSHCISTIGSKSCLLQLLLALVFNQLLLQVHMDKLLLFPVEGMQYLVLFSLLSSWALLCTTFLGKPLCCFVVPHHKQGRRGEKKHALACSCWSPSAQKYFPPSK